jgi:hypothetical protein
VVAIEISSRFQLFQSALMSAFMKKDLEAFRYALDNRRADPNLVDPKIDMTIFEKVLMTPKSTEFINACIEHGADLYEVSEKFWLLN